jgi:hypothetical protein
VAAQVVVSRVVPTVSYVTTFPVSIQHGLDNVEQFDGTKISIPVSFCPGYVAHDFTWDRMRAPVMGSRRLT